jgi:hypothetical protein
MPHAKKIFLCATLGMRAIGSLALPYTMGQHCNGCYNVENLYS